MNYIENIKMMAVVKEIKYGNKNFGLLTSDFRLHLREGLQWKARSARARAAAGLGAESPALRARPKPYYT